MKQKKEQYIRAYNLQLEVLRPMILQFLIMDKESFLITNDNLCGKIIKTPELYKMFYEGPINIVSLRNGEKCRPFPKEMKEANEQIEQDFKIYGHITIEIFDHEKNNFGIKSGLNHALLKAQNINPDSIEKIEFKKHE